jgi:hypothetical protein
MADDAARVLMDPKLRREMGSVPARRPSILTARTKSFHSTLSFMNG